MVVGLPEVPTRFWGTPSRCHLLCLCQLSPCQDICPEPVVDSVRMVTRAGTRQAGTWDRELVQAGMGVGGNEAGSRC